MIESILKLARETKGFLEPEEGRRLYEVALEAAALGPCLEIGSYCGKSTLFLGAACRARGATLFSVDHHGGSEEQQPGESYFDAGLFDPFLYRIDTYKYFRKTLQAADLEDTVVAVVARSRVAARDWSTPLSMVFIDGGHAFDTVLGDYGSWNSHIVPGGYLLMHDIFSDPADGGQAPYQVYCRAAASGAYRTLPMTRSLGVLQKI